MPKYVRNLIILLMVINMISMGLTGWKFFQPNPPKEKFMSAQEIAEISCIAHAVYHEARGESMKGQLAVAYVVMNRRSPDGRRNDACDVVYAPDQFTDIRKTVVYLSTQEWRNAVAMAEVAYWHSSPDPTKGARFFYAPKKVHNPRWAQKQIASLEIGNHKFFNLDD